jgi:hypothetical protein
LTYPAVITILRVEVIIMAKKVESPSVPPAGAEGDDEQERPFPGAREGSGNGP